MGKDTFIVYTEWNALLEGLTDAQVGQIFRGIFVIQNGGTYEFTSDVAGIANFFMNKISKNAEKYEEICRKRSEIAKERERKKAQSRTSVHKIAQEFTSEGDTDNEPDNDTDNDTDTERYINVSPIEIKKSSMSGRKKKFIPPTLEEVQDYFFNHMDYCIDYIEPDLFFAHHESTNWEGVENWRPLAIGYHKLYRRDHPEGFEDED